MKLICMNDACKGHATRSLKVPMTDIAIRVENLSKLYHIGARQERHDTLRDALVARFRRANGSTHPQATDSDDTDLWALRDVSFEVKRGEVVGIIGRNGAGKSTLLKILSRITEPTSGQAEIHGRVGSLLEVGTGFHPELTGRENIYLNGAILGMRRTEIDRKFDEIVAFAEIEKFLDTPVKRYSSGMYVRLAFAVAAHLEPEILLVDEVLAVGDAEFQKKCLGKMGDVAKEGRTVLFVSHNMSAIAALCNMGIFLKSGSVAQCGETAYTIQQYIEETSYQAEDYQEAQSTRDLFAAPRRHRSDLAQFTRIAVLNALGEACSTFGFGDTLRLRLQFRVSQPIRVAAEAILKSSSSQNIAFFASSHFQSILIQGNPQSDNIIELTIPRLVLARGRYRFDIGISIPHVEWLDFIEDACRFDVETSDPGGTGYSFEQSYGFGSIYVDHTWFVPELLHNQP